MKGLMENSSILEQDSRKLQKVYPFKYEKLLIGLNVLTAKKRTGT